MIHPPYLQPGDKIAITCPAKKLDKPMDDAIALLNSWGLQVVLGQTVNASHHQFAGTDEMRAQEMQQFINDKSIKAIIAARGGYGCVRIVDKIDFSPMIKNPKWLVGFSDITVFHCALQSMGIQSIHGQMPITIPDSTSLGLQTLRKALFGEYINYNYQPNATTFIEKHGEIKGTLIGGNLSILVSLLGSVHELDYTNKVLFIEDVGEYLYATDRMLHTLDRAGKLSKLKGLIVGSFTKTQDNPIPFGQSPEEIIYHKVKKYNYPVAFGFPAGHLNDNRALILGSGIFLHNSI
ncbi:MAG: LD-carboxypeptidase [Sphingobacteriales bacterium]|nr:MAG: LD-carboxypeptidase [Sphingobacteriales bacterium]TAF78728.1 MAG: LD-carboxypeptidase [Sphingobacteriales bacterium]